VSLQGEISNLKAHSSGHFYFTLKDEHARIQCVMFHGDASGLKFMPADGMAVVVKGQISVYEREGRYQVYVRQMEPAGLGDLFARFEALKARLEAEGFFRSERKKPLPRYAERIGVVTSADSAAWRDIQSVLSRRNTAVQVTLCPAAVQGITASAELARALQTLDRLGLDVIILARGGGSIEELWAFNEEPLARALLKLKTPIVTGIGHETDFTIADFTADLRAATPSAAAELAVSDKRAVSRELKQALHRLSGAAERRLVLESHRLEKVAPSRMGLAFKHLLDRRTHQCTAMMVRQRTAMDRRMQKLEHQIQLSAQRLDSASPLRILDKGYALVTGETGRRITSADAVSVGQCVAVKLKDGDLTCRVENKSRGVTA
jgi:exodeoxyribonuclease VII large subunit